jgi:hypothetical protein
MEKLPTLDALVSINPSKQHDFLYVIKKVNTSENPWLPKISKAIVANMIKSPGLYQITYRLYTNKAGYEAIYIGSAKKLVTE